MKAVRIKRSFRLRMKWIVTIVLAVALMAVILIGIAAKQPDSETPGIAILRGEYIAAIVDGEGLAAFDALTISFDGASYSAVPLEVVLKRFNAQPTLYESAVCIGDVQVELDGTDLVRASGAYIAYEREGEPIPDEEGGPYLLLQIGRGGTTGVIEHLSQISISLQE